MSRFYRFCLCLFTAFFVIACGGGGGGDDEGASGGGGVDEVGQPGTPVLNGSFNLSVVDGITTEWNTALTSVLQPSVAYVNRIIDLPKDIPISMQNCGVANAFYLPERSGESIAPIIFMCWELYDQIILYFDAEFEDDLDTSFQVTNGAYTHVMYHEIGHAIDEQLALPIVGNTESAADAIATVLAVEQGFGINTLAAALLFDADGDGSFADVHAGGADRAGDLFCWALGGDPTLAESFSSITQIFIDSGRDCVSEYAGQVASVSSWLPNISGPVGKATRTIASADALTEETLTSLRDAMLNSTAISNLLSAN